MEQPKKVVGKAVKGRDNKAKVKDSEYYVTPDNYFIMHSSKKVSNQNF